MQAEAPAFGRLDHLPAERLGHQLMAETHAHDRRLALGLLQEAARPGDPGIAIVDAGRRAGDQIAIVVFRSLGKRGGLHVDHRPVVRLLTQQMLEHVAVAAEPGRQTRWWRAGLQDRDLQFAIPCTTDFRRSTTDSLSRMKSLSTHQASTSRMTAP